MASGRETKRNATKKRPAASVPNAAAAWLAQCVLRRPVNQRVSPRKAPLKGRSRICLAPRPSRPCRLSRAIRSPGWAASRGLTQVPWNAVHTPTAVPFSTQAWFSQRVSITHRAKQIGRPIQHTPAVPTTVPRAGGTHESTDRISADGMGRSIVRSKSCVTR
jgi:hypothetical protein